MPIKSLLIETISKVSQKISSIVISLEQNAQRKETADLKKLDGFYAEGCGPIAEVKVIQALEHGGIYSESSFDGDDHSTTG